jgi:hypothetical protein
MMSILFRTSAMLAARIARVIVRRALYDTGFLMCSLDSFRRTCASKQTRQDAQPQRKHD